jgi:hypothetical protein
MSLNCFCREKYGGVLLFFCRDAVATVVDALHYKPADRGFDSEGVIGIFQCCNPSGRNTALGSTQPLTESSTKNISFGIKTAGA